MRTHRRLARAFVVVVLATLACKDDGSPPSTALKSDPSEASTPRSPQLPDADLARAMEEDHRALDAFVRGDPEPKKRLYSRRDDVTLANPLGPPARGWEQVEATLTRASSLLRDGEAMQFERVSGYATADLAYIVEIERTRVKIAGASELSPSSLRVTTVFRREENGWKIVHRHADNITTPRTPDSLRDQSVKP